MQREGRKEKLIVFVSTIVPATAAAAATSTIVNINSQTRVVDGVLFCCFNEARRVLLFYQFNFTLCMFCWFKDFWWGDGEGGNGREQIKSNGTEIILSWLKCLRQTEIKITTFPAESKIAPQIFPRSAYFMIEALRVAKKFLSLDLKPSRGELWWGWRTGCEGKIDIHHREFALKNSIFSLVALTLRLADKGRAQKISNLNHGNFYSWPGDYDDHDPARHANKFVQFRGNSWMGKKVEETAK